MHRTKTIDYIIILEGKLTMLLDNDKVELKPFDVVIQRATVAKAVAGAYFSCRSNRQTAIRGQKRKELHEQEVV